jgi:hypothetical protein
LEDHFPNRTPSKSSPSIPIECNDIRFKTDAEAISSTDAEALEVFTTESNTDASLSQRRTACEASDL